MNEVHAPMTGLEACFEDELSSVPGWHKDEIPSQEEAESRKPSKETEEAKKIEEVMILGR